MLSSASIFDWDDRLLSGSRRVKRTVFSNYRISGCVYDDGTTSVMCDDQTDGDKGRGERRQTHNGPRERSVHGGFADAIQRENDEWSLPKRVAGDAISYGAAVKRSRVQENYQSERRWRRRCGRRGSSGRLSEFTVIGSRGSRTSCFLGYPTV